MKKLTLLLIVLFTINISTAQTSKAEVNQIIKEQSDGIVNNSQKGVATVYNDGKSVVTTVYSDLKSSAPKVYKALESLAKELKTTTDALWVILVKQQLVWSICFLILTLTSIFNWYLFYKNTHYKLKEGDFTKGLRYKNTNDRNPEYRSYAKLNTVESNIYLQEPEEILIPLKQSKIENFKYIHLIICILLSGLSIHHFSDMLTGFINPEFGALKTITIVVQSFK